MNCWVTLDDTLGNAEALVDAMADTLPEVEAVTPGNTLGDAYALNDLLGDSWRHTGQCGSTGPQLG